MWSAQTRAGSAGKTDGDRLAFLQMVLTKSESPPCVKNSWESSRKGQPPPPHPERLQSTARKRQRPANTPAIAGNGASSVEGVASTFASNPGFLGGGGAGGDAGAPPQPSAKGDVGTTQPAGALLPARLLLWAGEEKMTSARVSSQPQSAESQHLCGRISCQRLKR